MPRKGLSDEVKTFIVQALACFDSPSVVADAAMKELGVQVTRQQVEKYDPTKKAGQHLSQKYRTLFEETRKAFLEDTSKIGVSHRAVRLRKLETQIALNEKRGNSAMVAQLLKQAAEEMGNAYTNRRELTGKDGKDLPAVPAQVTFFQLPDNGRD
ncbi:DUF2280 domain-containing protein [Chelativorans sp. AA-79]|uniref:DUF2280 domain-containing protein n=1 Tax=Chelativorans sp. AA-79 TaxID=3028735 RepID=UPI0023F8B432|nr:DUF2280 domain-containing protein [Chelativorans sp. AA-79]WEX10297.1 DUF2280 domain-containing protein [Chelativorans sp. AA-79]